MPSSRPVFPPANEATRQTELDTAETLNKGHGRREHRRLEASTRLARHLDWPGVKQVCRLTRTTWRSGRQTVEVAYAITSVPRAQASAAQLLAWWRGHWRIENQLHWVRDVVMSEDDCRIRTGHAPQILATFRNVVLNLLRLNGLTQTKASLRRFAFCPDKLRLLIGNLKL